MCVHSGVGEEAWPWPKSPGKGAVSPRSSKMSKSNREGKEKGWEVSGEWVVLREGHGSSSGKHISGVLEGSVCKPGCSELPWLIVDGSPCHHLGEIENRCAQE